MHVEQEISKKQHGDKFSRIVTEEGLAKRPCMVTVGTNGCGSMALLCAAAMERGINPVYLPPFSLADNPVKGIMNHLKTDVAAVLLSAMAVRGGLSEAHIGYVTEYITWMRERFAHMRQGEHICSLESVAT